MSENKKYKGKFIWSKEATICLIECYQNNPILYNISDPSYKNKPKREAALSKIKDELMKLDYCKNQCISVEDVKNKIHVLRTQFNKEYKRVEASKTTGAGLSEVFEPTLWCYEHLFFLKDSNKVLESSSNFDDSFDQSQTLEVGQDEIIFEGPINSVDDLMLPEISEHQVAKTKGSKGSMQKEVIKLLSTATASLEARNNNNDNDIDSFCRHLGNEMKRIKNVSRIRRMKLAFMQSVMNEQEEQEREG